MGKQLTMIYAFDPTLKNTFPLLKISVYKRLHRAYLAQV